MTVRHEKQAVRRDYEKPYMMSDGTNTDRESEATYTQR